MNCKISLNNINMDKEKEINRIITKINELTNESILDLSIRINYIIENNIIDENYIGNTFDYLLSLVFAEELEIKKLYIKLIEYSFKINKGLAYDYIKMYEGNFENEIFDNKVKKIGNKF